MHVEKLTHIFARAQIQWNLSQYYTFPRLEVFIYRYILNPLLARLLIFQVKGQVNTGQSEAKIMSINFMLISYKLSKTYFVDTHQDSSIMYPREDSQIRLTV